MKKNIILGIGIAFSLLTLSACGSKTENGLKYKTLVKGTGRPAQMGDLVKGTLTLSSQDSILMSSGDKPEIILQIMESIFPGDLNEGLLSMCEGDSTNFYMPLDSLEKYMGQGMLPDFVKKELVYSVKIDKLYTEEEFQAEENLKAAEAEEVENAAIADYLLEHNLNIEPTESGIYFIEVKKGIGKTAAQSQRVKVNYIGRRLDGKLFDTNIETIAKAEGTYIPQRTYEPMSVMAGVGQMIPGFDQALTMMKKGSKATIIIPFKLAYGSRAVSEDIPAYTTLVFDLEMVDIE